MANFDFKSREQIEELIKEAEVDLKAEELINYFKALKKERNPFFINKKDLEKILVFKLRGQYHRQVDQRNLNNDEVIKVVSKAAFEVVHTNNDYEIELKLNLLTSLKGIGVPVASAILALTYPEKYAVIDKRNWEQIFGNLKSNYTVCDYLKYLKVIKTLSSRYGFTYQEVDMAIWELNKKPYITEQRF